ncbi:MAG: hypothetical protein L6Q59_17295 [Ignavibacteriaceae bacterium]|nr:hypothetical protein [Ignavibacteriaceae bacterium]
MPKSLHKIEKHKAGKAVKIVVQFCRDAYPDAVSDYEAVLNYEDALCRELTLFRSAGISIDPDRLEFYFLIKKVRERVYRSSVISDISDISDISEGSNG